MRVGRAVSEKTKDHWFRRVDFVAACQRGACGRVRDSELESGFRVAAIVSIGQVDRRRSTIVGLDSCIMSDRWIRSLTDFTTLTANMKPGKALPGYSNESQMGVRSKICFARLR